MTSPAKTVFPGDASPAELLYPDLAQELASTRRMLERVPDGNDDWAPHTKSMTLGRLATHVAELPSFATTILTTDVLDLDKMDWTPKVFANNAERLAMFDKLAAEMTSGITGADWATLSGDWTMLYGGKEYLRDRKATLLRTLGLSHIAHHRAQLGVSLRELNIAIPGMYGPSADEM